MEPGAYPNWLSHPWKPPPPDPLSDRWLERRPPTPARSPPPPSIPRIWSICPGISDPQTCRRPVGFRFGFVGQVLAPPWPLGPPGAPEPTGCKDQTPRLEEDPSDSFRLCHKPTSRTAENRKLS